MTRSSNDDVLALLTEAFQAFKADDSGKTRELWIEAEQRLTDRGYDPVKFWNSLAH